MERLTNHEMDNYNEPGCDLCSAYCYEMCKIDDAVKDCAKRLRNICLAAYEDTGLTPEEVAELAQAKNEKPKIVCLCGSTRFYEEFQRANYDLTMKGEIVLSVGFYPHSARQAHGEEIGCTSEQKMRLDELHKRKIDICDYVFVLNKDGYIGESTRSEIEYAINLGKPVSYLEAVQAALEAQEE